MLDYTDPLPGSCYYMYALLVDRVLQVDIQAYGAISVADVVQPALSSLHSIMPTNFACTCGMC